MNDIGLTRLITGICATLIFIFSCIFLVWKTKTVNKGVVVEKEEEANDIDIKGNVKNNSLNIEEKHSEPAEKKPLIHAGKTNKTDKTSKKYVSKPINTTTKFKKFEALNGKPRDCYINKEVGGHSQPLVSMSFSANGIVSTLGHDRLLRCSPVIDIGSASPHEYHCTLENKNNTTPTCMTCTMNGRRILTGEGDGIDFYKLPVDANVSTITIPKQLLFVKRLDCSIPPTTSTNPYNCTATATSAANKNNHASTVIKMNIRSIRTMDVEKWLVVLVSGELEISTTVLTSSLPYTRDMMHADTYTVIKFTLPFIRAYNHSGSVVFTLTPQHTAAMTTVGNGIGGVGGFDTNNTNTANALKKGSSYKYIPIGSQEGCKCTRVTEMHMAVSKDSRVVAISGAGVYDTYSNRDGRDACGLKCDEVGVFTVSRINGGEASGLTLAYILSIQSTQSPHSHSHGLIEHSVCLDLSWCSDSKSLVCLYCNTNTHPKAISQNANEMQPPLSGVANNNQSDPSDSWIHFASWDLSVLPLPTKGEILRSVAVAHTVPLPPLPVESSGNSSSIGPSPSPILSNYSGISHVLLLKSAMEDSWSSIVTIALGRNIYFFIRETGQCVHDKTLRDVTNYFIREMHLSSDGLMFSTVVENAKRAPLWRYHIDVNSSRDDH